MTIQPEAAQVDVFAAFDHTGIFARTFFQWCAREADGGGGGDGGKPPNVDEDGCIDYHRAFAEAKRGVLNATRRGANPHGAHVPKYELRDPHGPPSESRHAPHPIAAGIPVLLSA